MRAEFLKPWTDLQSQNPVVAFTAALFLSGYAIQQRTVRNLRAAIRPDTSPQIYLPDRFRDDTTELADGTIVMLDEYGRPVRLKSGRISIGKAPPATSEDEMSDENETEAVDVEIQETLPEVMDQQEQTVMAENVPPEDEQVELVESQDQKPLQDEPVQPPQPQLAPWEIRREDMPEETHEESPSEDGEKPISRAERRRLIKEEIQKLSQGETPLYYQRRLW